MRRYNNNYGAPEIKLIESDQQAASAMTATGR